MAAFDASHEGRVSLLDDEGFESFSLSADCGGEPCRVAVDRAAGRPSEHAQPVVRIVAPRPGDLRLHVANGHGLNAVYFVIRRVEDSLSASDIDQREGSRVNDWNILGARQRGTIDRDASTGCSMVVEAVEAPQGGPVKEVDPAASSTPRTRFSVLVAPAVSEGKWEPTYWSPRRWVATKASQDLKQSGDKVWVRVWVVPSGCVKLVPAWGGQTVFQFKQTLANMLEDATADRVRLFHLTEEPLDDSKTLDNCCIGHEYDVQAVVAAAPSRRPTLGRLLQVRARCFAFDAVRDLVLPLRARATVRELKEAARRELRADAEDEVRAVRVGLPVALLDDWLLCEVADEASRVHLILTRGAEKGAKIAVKVMTVTRARPTTMYILKTSLVAELKRRIQAEEGFPPHLQKVLFGAAVLQDHVRITDYGVTPNDAHLSVVLNVAGGGSAALPEGAEKVDAVSRQEPQKGEEVAADAEEDPADAELVVAKVVSGQRRAAPRTTRSHLAALLTRAAPMLVVEVSLAPQLAQQPALEAAQEPAVDAGRQLRPRKRARVA